jgi:hypothetical protein
MTDATLHGTALRAAAPAVAADGLRLGPVLLAALAAVILFSLPNMADPMIRHDDYPALFAEPAGFYGKTLFEGRWINYWWHLRSVVTPPWLNYALYQALWAVFAGATAWVVMRDQPARFWAVALAVLILVSPPAAEIALWFNTLIPGMAIVAAFALLACRVSDRALLGWLVVFVPLALMAYTTFPILLLAIALYRQERRSLGNLALVMGVFGGSFIAGLMLTYTLNWFEHGVFGVQLDVWRNATPAHDLAGMLANLPKLTESLVYLAERAGMNFTPTVIALPLLFAGAIAVLIRRAPREALYLLTGLATGMALITLQALKLGVHVPPRAFIFAWVFLAIALCRAALLLSQDSPRAARLAHNFALLVTASFLVQGAILHTAFHPWQAQTRAIAAQIRDLPGPVLVTGRPSQIAIARAAGIQDDMAFALRMQLLAGQSVQLCDRPGTTPACDPALIAAPTTRVRYEGPATIRVTPAGTVIDLTAAMTSEPARRLP